MSCCNTCGSNQGCNCIYAVVLPNNPVVGYSAKNINLTGIGVYDSTNGTEFDFRGIVSGNNSLLVTLDAGNHSVLLTFNIAQIISDLPDATTSQRGVLETATNAEAQGKVLDNKILTPANLAALGSTTSFAGLVELATNAEAIAGAATNLAVTPANLAAVAAISTTTRVFADAVARAAVVPAFKGQFGYQQDTLQPYSAYDTVAGAWYVVIGEGAENPLTAPTNILFNGATQLTFASTHCDGTLHYENSEVHLDSVGLNLNAGSRINFAIPTAIRVNSVDIPANSILTTGGTAGQLSSRLISTTVSTANTQTGYTTFANSATLRTCDTATVTLQQLAQIVGTLVGDLKAAKLPAT